MSSPAVVSDSSSTSYSSHLHAPPPLPGTLPQSPKIPPPRPPTTILLCVSALQTTAEGRCFFVTNNESIKDCRRQNGRTILTGAGGGGTQISSLKLQFKQCLLMACCFCCCPVFRCTLWFCAVELIISAFLWFNRFNDLIRNFHNSIGLKDVFLFLVLTGWVITLGVSTVSLIMAQRKKNPKLVWPRLVQLSGFFVLEFLFVLFLVIYFAGAHQTINNWLIAFHEKVFSDPLNHELRQEAQDTLRTYFAGLILLDFVLICYTASALCTINKYYRELRAETWTFQAVGQHDTVAPTRQPPMNPHYKVSVS